MDKAERQFVSDYWWVLTVRGIAAILFGIAAVFWPGLTLVTLVYLFGAFVLVNGVVSVVHGIGGVGKHQRWIWTLLIGLIEIGVGVYLLRHPGVNFALLILIISFTLIAVGVAEVIATFVTKNIGATERLLTLLGGAAAVIVGIVLLFQSEAAGVAFVWVLGLYALITGPILVALSIDAKNIAEGKK